ncbi:MAG: cation:dicarboxylase symporter family transporter [Saprospiraceae bacterium]|jgi:proton glutamate symport protein|uniref:dicarboxylate/amino acid:cation symporter n=1 Tax=Candidatus Brachybacter algidus TaxID=2982024 RepID=UPI001B7B29C7|nr:cation:dicarboxylase symporter family transporter [Candidatus Brachybacter algidus]MBP7540241.1 cation:dicarboxylase symporter family transporter [Saprospiraceae bacterium]MBK6371946.1 cation:dicarboxylase symporter family transporter [Candidatus Brachybacter algidus]MBK6448732.1 cation:dicarboxylase symporter family transporter [Candidatus Brachybacter algidus]MBK7603643.1 cation:dicarboxylase symporter family transporter [Candidatus Brachybacter algidus]MBK8357053.1 cation:dicarboxylase s
MGRKNLSVIIILLALFIVGILQLSLSYFGANIHSTIITSSHILVMAAFIFYAIQKKNLTTWILVSMVIGALIGHEFPDVGQNMRVLSQVFLKLIKTIIAPILFSTLVVGIAGHSNLKQVGRMGWKSILYFEVVTTFALIIGLIAINISQAGVGIVLPEGMHETLPEVTVSTWQDIILHIFPENIAKSIYHAEVLPIVVFSVLFGIGLAMLDERKKRPMLEFCESLAETMFKFTNIIMYFAPVGVGAAIAYTVGHMGLGILVNLIQLLLTLYAALIVFVLGVLLPVALIARIPVINFLKAVIEPMSIAFATTSSESALPKAMQAMERLGVPRKIVAFVIPTGYSFNLDGTTLYLSLASIFVAQAAGMHMDVPTQILLVFTLMLTSKGVAGVPRASLVILLATAAQFNLPTWPILVILGIDELMDMARTSINVMGNCLASCVVARWEGEFVPRDPSLPLESEQIITT